MTSNKRPYKNLQIKLLNIQGLTKVKAIELESLFGNNDILCLTETQQKMEKINFSKNVKYVTSMRDVEEKKGGGLMILYKNGNILMKKIETIHKDILIIQCQIYGLELRMILIYMSVSNYDANKHLMKYIQDHIQNIKNYIILGDFNGHIGFLGPQPTNKNGELMLDLIDNNNLILLNGHADCRGEVTWQQRERKSTIDYLIVDEEMHQRFKNMIIDEQKEEFDLSDHNMLTAIFTLENNDHNQFKDKAYTKMTYVKINEETSSNFTTQVKTKLCHNTTLEQYEDIIKDAKQQCMVRTINKRFSNISGEEEKPWFGEKIKREISIRKKYNRERRNEPDKCKREVLGRKYQEQKYKTQRIIKEEINKYERKITNIIKKEKGHKKLWDIVNTLRGKKKHDPKEEKLYDMNEIELPTKEWNKHITAFWGEIYQKHDNTIAEQWNPLKRELYSKEYKKIEAIAEYRNHVTQIPYNLHEHYDMQAKVSYIGYMEDPHITTDDVTQQIRKIKERKSAGPDGIKPDLLKIIGNDIQCINILAESMNKIITKEDNIPESWYTSKTVLVPKTKKPTVKDLRPIALTNATYKLFMGILKTKIEHHIRYIKEESEVQAGFTKNRRISDNLIVLDYCVKESFKRKKNLYLISIDFQKAFDSIKRDTLIYALKKYRIHPLIIDVIANIYSKDKTQLYFNSIHQDDINITSGIRQGCNGSSNLFLLVTYIIIERMYSCLNGINTNICKIVALFFADDGMILMQTLQEAEKSIQILSDIAKTQLYFNSIHQDDINITSGIRQGCNGSSNLFLLVTYIIIERMYSCLNGINTNICKIVALFFADDGMILMQTLQEAEKSIQILSDIANDCGLSINKNKSNIIIFNSKNQPEYIEDIHVTTNITYLGVKIQNKKDCYKLHRIEASKKAKKYSSMMPAVIAKSCNKILIGKTYWKCAALPSILHGTEAIYLSNNYLADLQIEENKALRYTVNARRKTAISALRGEFGISLQITRDMKSKILFIKHILQPNSLLREIFIHTFEEKKPTKWIKQVKKYMIDLHLTLHTIEYSKHQHIRRRIKEFDDKLWQEDLQKKSSLILYRKYKEIICDEQNYV